MNKKLAAAVVALGAALLVGGCAAGATDAPGSAPTPTKAHVKSLGQKALDAAKGCNMTGKMSGLDTTGDGGHTVTLETTGTTNYTTSMPASTASCILHAMGVPDVTMDLIGSTTAIDGRQTDDWGDVSLSWTYTPSSGLDLIMSEDTVVSAAATAS
jgi:hypothetical protein